MFPVSHVRVPFAQLVQIPHFSASTFLSQSCQPSRDSFTRGKEKLSFRTLEGRWLFIIPLQRWAGTCKSTDMQGNSYRCLEDWAHMSQLSASCLRCRRFCPMCPLLPLHSPPGEWTYKQRKDILQEAKNLFCWPQAGRFRIPFPIPSTFCSQVCLF